MKRRRKRVCRHCHHLFDPDPRNRRHQHYCAEPACRKASKAASQRRWLNKPANRDYFRGAENVQRVRNWRSTHPGYWRLTPAALQEDLLTQPIETNNEFVTLTQNALQDVLTRPDLILLGLIAQLTDSTLQEDIAETGRRLLGLGGTILTSGGCHARQTYSVSGAGPPDSRPL